MDRAAVVRSAGIQPRSAARVFQLVFVITFSAMRHRAIHPAKAKRVVDITNAKIRARVGLVGT